MKGHIIAVDQSTSSSKVFLLGENAEILRRYSKEHKQFYPQSGQAEHDAGEIWRYVLEGIHAVAQDMDAAGLAISNQRETTVFWDRQTGEPLCRAIVWQDVRGEYICRELAQHASRVKELTGLSLSAYFLAAKAAAKLREDPSLRKRAEEGSLCIGTVDSYLIHRLTGGRVFATDVSNASRTQLMNLHTLAWSEELCKLFDIPLHCLPAIHPSDHMFGTTRLDGLAGVPITGVMGDSHAAFFGQGCDAPGLVKATFGTGSSVMMHIGSKPVLSSRGLATSVGYSMNGQTCYVLEGNITSSGDTLRWLRDEMGMVADVAEVEKEASLMEDAGGVYLVPAFSGLGAPYNQPEARAVISGISRGNGRRHILRAALESMAFQDADVIAAMAEDTNAPLSELRVDGGPTANQTLMQFLADVLGYPVQCAAASELSALGAGLMAARKLNLWQGATLKKGVRYAPGRDQAWRNQQLMGWRAAVNRSAQE